MSGNGIYLVSNGCKVLVPKEYQCLNVAGIGLVVYKDDVFQMKLVVGDSSYEEGANNPETLTEKAVEAGGKILEPVKETEVDGRKYLYFVMELSGEKNLVIYSQAADSNKRIAGQIVIQSDTVTNEDMICMFAGIAGSAVKTDEKDIQKILVACNLGEKMFYSVEAESCNEEKELTMDSIMDFLSVTSE